MARRLLLAASLSALLIGLLALLAGQFRFPSGQVDTLRPPDASPEPLAPPASAATLLAQTTVGPLPTAAPTEPPQRAQAPSAAPTRQATPVPSLTAVSVAGRLQAPAAASFAAAEAPARDPLALAARLKRIAEPIPVVVNATPPAYSLGDQAPFWVGNTDTSEQFQITATLRAMTPHVYMWVEDGYTVEQAALERSAQRFEDRTYPTDRALFGSEWMPGVDNDVRLTILNTHGLGGRVAGYYSTADEFSNLVNPFSNQREIFYINLDVLQPGTQGYDSTLAHEFQHMIHWANDRNEDAWVNEGFSTVAEFLNNYNAGFYPEEYLRTPDTQLTAWAVSGQRTSPHYGGSFLFTLYFLQRFGEDGARQVVAEQANGAAGFEALLVDHQLSFDEVFVDWVAANYLRDSEIDEGRYGYRRLDPPAPQLSAVHSTYPVQKESTVHQYGADYILLEGEGDVRIAFQGTPEVKVVPNDPHSGQYQWWGNYGDESDMTLTRAFDLTELARATLEAWLWYDIEEGWDYAYIEVSNDGGESWHILTGKYTTDYNPNGNAFGPGYTGRSGSDQEPDWVREQIDLSSYAGQEILVRFEYITDDAVNHPGICVDDVTIPELGYLDDMEGGENWEAAGFVRTNNRLPQHFAVQVIEMSDPPRVRSMALSSQNGARGEIVVHGLGQSVEKVILAVSGLTPVTMEMATYSYTVEPLLEID